MSTPTMNEPKPDPPTRASSSSSALPPSIPSAAARNRLPQRASTIHEASPSPRPYPYTRRRSSLLSYSSLDDATHSLDEMINPRTGGRKSGKDDDELSHWHSSPLAFAILPAVGGLLFQNGQTFVTDVLLLGLAAIFMNWSIRLPWDWYYSAQALRRDVEPDYRTSSHLEDETAVETASSEGSSPKHSPDRTTSPEPETPVQNVPKREEAASDLRRQELLALIATFLFPVLAAYLLHVIREQLSRPSTGLVSDYNLSIFILAAEIRPVRQVARLVTNRTLHLQRTVTGLDDPFAATLDDKNRISDLTSRLIQLEAKLADHTNVPPTMTIAQKGDIGDLSVEMRKRYEPRLEGLERAVRRYEKRSITLASGTEGRFQSLETRLQEALSLAAVAAQSNQNRGAFAKLLDTMTSALLYPVKIAWSVLTWPFAVIDDLYLRIKTLLLGPMPSRSGKARRGRRDGSVSGEKGSLGRGAEKDRSSLNRKAVR